MAISIVIPVFNSHSSLPDLTCRITRVLEAITTRFEIIFVNDGSRDNSWQVISELSAKYNKSVRGINLMRNYGQHNAVLCGIRAARFPIIVTMDDDLQNPAEEIPLLLERLNDDVDVVYGAPITQQHGLLRTLASQITKLVLQETMGAETARSISPFRAFRTCLRDSFRDCRNTFVSIDVLLTWGTSRFATVRVKHDMRKHGASNYNFRKLVTHAVNMVVGFSTLPLQMASLNGFFFILLGLVLLVYIFGRYLIHGGSVPGFPFLASVIIIFSGAQLFALGIIGEYLARIHVRSMEKPTYVIASETQVLSHEVEAR